VSVQKDFRRALCLLDPYKLNIDWSVLEAAGRMRTVEIFYNFMIMDANMNVLMRDPAKVTPEQAARMTAVWGDESWREVAYRRTRDLFGELDEKVSNEEIAEAFRLRLKKVAGFAYVPPPLPMRNSKGAVVYYLYFASPNATGGDIVTQIFNKYRDMGAR
jgi:three-Cys-motif partner protein